MSEGIRVSPIVEYYSETKKIRLRINLLHRGRVLPLRDTTYTLPEVCVLEGLRVQTGPRERLTWGPGDVGFGEVVRKKVSLGIRDRLETPRTSDVAPITVGEPTSLSPRHSTKEETKRSKGERPRLNLSLTTRLSGVTIRS